MTKTAAVLVALAVTAALLGTVSAAFAAGGHARGLQTAGPVTVSFRMFDT